MKTARYQRGFWNFIIPAAASIIGGLLSKEGQQDANSQNLQIAREQMDFNAQQAEINRNFQQQSITQQQDYATNMANTSYQRAVGDLSKAGLNPMLAYSQGGAASFQGSAASGSQASYNSIPVQQNTAQAGVSGALAALQLQNISKQGDNIDADTALKQAQANRETASAGNLKYQTEKLIVGDIPKAREEIKTIQNQNISWQTQNALNEAQILLTKAEAMVKNEQIGLTEGQAALTKVNKALAELQIPEAKAYAEKYGTDFGKDVSPYVKEIIDILKALIYGRHMINGR